MIDYEVIQSGSSGNAVLINGVILIDCGVSYKKLTPYVRNLKLVLLTHAHSDHFKPRTAAALHRERPALRWGCCDWMVAPLLKAGIKPRLIDMLPLNRRVSYHSFCDIEAVEVPHNVRNCAYKLYFKKGDSTESLFYCTDCSTLNGVVAEGFDLYMIEENRTEAEFDAAIAAKRAAGQFAYEEAARQNHMTREQAEAWLVLNADSHSRYVPLHQHQMEEK